MKTTACKPLSWRLDTLLSLGTNHVHELALRATGSLTSLRLLLGRCLLALHENKGYKQFGCSSSVHYASQILGVGTREARECRRVARELQPLGELTLAAERGTITWSKLREVVRKATPATESYWLALCLKFNAEQIQELARRTPWGSLPGEVFAEEEQMSTELRCPMSPQVFRMLAHARRLYSIEQEEVVTNADIVEMALATYIAGRPIDAEVLEKTRAEADKDLQAQEARRLPLVYQAREVAQEMGLLGETSVQEPDDVALKMPAEKYHAEETHAEEADHAEKGHAEETHAEKGRPGGEHAEKGHAEVTHAEKGRPGGEHAEEYHAEKGHPEEAHAEEARRCDSDLLAQALGGPTEEISLCSDGGQNDEPKRPAWVAADTSNHAKSPSNLQPAQASWSNSRLRFNPQSRLATKAQRKEILRRDGWCCQTPGCPHRVWLHLHHLKSYSEGGETSAVNLCSLCGSCHANLHSGALQIKVESDGTLRFLDGEGRRLDRRANLEVAGWLDWWHGWEGAEEDSHGAQTEQGLWGVAV